jgi:hypothetical protein
MSAPAVLPDAPCPHCGECQPVVAECCDTWRQDCQTGMWSDMTACRRGTGCDT